MTLTGTTPGAATNFEALLIYVDGCFAGPPSNIAGTAMNIDNFKFDAVRAVPETTSLALFGLCGLGLVFRRRR